MADQDRITEAGVREGGCGRPLAEGQHWLFCGETDMGQSPPYLCTKCGGDLKLEEEDD